jgi:desumoylating isopeptidase 1
MSGSAAAAPWRVELLAYDISRGMARSFAPMLGLPIEAVWHTSVVVRDGHAQEEEVFFGYGVQRAPVGTTPFGAPIRVIPLGTTELDRDTRLSLLADLGERYQPHHYRLVDRNCNHFASEYAELVCGVSSPDEIVHQARDLLQTPLGSMLRPMLAQLESVTGRATATGFGGGGVGGGGAGAGAGGGGSGRPP